MLFKPSCRCRIFQGECTGMEAARASDMLDNSFSTISNDDLSLATTDDFGFDEDQLSTTNEGA